MSRIPKYVEEDEKESIPKKMMTKEELEKTIKEQSAILKKLTDKDEVADLTEPEQKPEKEKISAPDHEEILDMIEGHLIRGYNLMALLRKQ